MSQTVVDRTSPHAAGFGQSRVLDAGVVVGASMLMAVCAHVSIPLWFTPVPITLQTFGLVFLALTLGGWRASAALVLYLAEGLCGLPVFSPHGLGGIAQLLGPTGGYLAAYPFAALAGGLLADRILKKSRIAGFAAGALVSDAIVFACGALWLLVLTHKSAGVILATGVLPFIPGEILKDAAAIALALPSRKILR